MGAPQGLPAIAVGLPAILAGLPAIAIGLPAIPAGLPVSLPQAVPAWPGLLGPRRSTLQVLGSLVAHSVQVLHGQALRTRTCWCCARGDTLRPRRMPSNVSDYSTEPFSNRSDRPRWRTAPASDTRALGAGRRPRRMRVGCGRPRASCRPPATRAGRRPPRRPPGCQPLSCAVCASRGSSPSGRRSRGARRWRGTSARGRSPRGWRSHAR